MFEITGNDIAQLNDEDLRSLIGLLCESEVIRRRLPRSSVTWGGEQCAVDGGVDVRVALPAQTSIEGFIPRPATVFQVKTEDIPPSGIESEMRPTGSIRPVIEELAAVSGGYVIVSSTSSTADPARKNRCNAMSKAVRDVPNRDALFLNFYDRGLIATWVRDHPELILWVRKKIGRSIPGWRPYDAWADRSDEPKAEYLLDANLRVLTGKQEDADGLDAVHAINRIRSLLSEPRNAVRLIGMSGVGKTRLVQALFDERVGEHHLDPSLAVYTDVSDEPDPPPVALATDWVATQVRKILVIDNCSPELHERLTKLCRSPESRLSLITVEYDIHEDEPEGTEAFRLEPSSIDLVLKLVSRRFSHISLVDARTVAEFSGGNARIAIALATTIGKNDSIAGLPGAELFDRLFQQRQPYDKSLKTSAEACSLVYSFQGEDVPAEPQRELAALGALVNQDAQEVYANVAELLRRGLAQRRSVWRAVLPPAIANRLAATALQNIPPDVIETDFRRDRTGRLLKSFSKRLGYLHDSKEAVAIVTKWFGVGGMLSDAPSLDDHGRSLFENVAPAAPEAALSALERAILGQDDNEALRRCTHFGRLLWSLAYDAKLFDRSVALMLKIADTIDAGEEPNEVTRAFTSLFSIVRSGTHASIEQRLRIIARLLSSDHYNHHKLGLAALDRALNAWRFPFVYPFAFGARSRDFGYHPRTQAEVKLWFGSVLRVAESLACSDGPCASGVRSALAGQFRGLWTKACVYDELEHLCRAISRKQFWREGWIAVRQTVSLDSKGLGTDISALLSSLEELLRPKDLVQRVRSMVFSRKLIGGSISEFWDGDQGGGQRDFGRILSIAKELGAAVAVDEAAFEELLAEMVIVEVSGSGRLWHFGRGVFEGSRNSSAMWDRLIVQLAATTEARRNVEVLRGFLWASQEKDPAIPNALLDDAVENETLAAWYPALEASIRIDELGVNRLKRSLACGKAPVRAYRSLAAGLSMQSIADKDVRDFLLIIATKPDGLDVAIELLSMLFGIRKDGYPPCGPEIVDVGRQLLRQLPFSKRQRDDDYNLQVVAKTCLVGQEGAAIARAMCHDLRDADLEFTASAFDYALLIEGLFAVQPTATLDGLLAGTDQEVRAGSGIIHEVCFNDEKNPVDLVPEEDLFSWCDRDPDARYPTVASVLTFSQKLGNTQELEWTKSALRLLYKAPDRAAVLKEFATRFIPMSWVGSRVAVIESYAKLLDSLEGYSDVAVAAAATQEKVRLREAIEEQKRMEAITDRGERFEW